MLILLLLNVQCRIYIIFTYKVPYNQLLNDNDSALEFLRDF